VSLGLVLGGLVTLVTDPWLWMLMLAAVPAGMVFGAVPGFGGKLGLVLAIPFVVGMEAIPGAVFLLALHAVVHTGGAIPSILLGIPGTGPDAATVCDGYPMTLRGEAARALGASLAASALGGVLGAVFLAALIPVVQPIVLAFGPPEFFLLAVLGITFIGAVSGTSLSRGVLVGAAGLLLSFVGSEPLAGIDRFALGLPFLTDGIGVLTAVLAVFTLPEVIALALRRPEVRDAAATAKYATTDLLHGVADVWRHRGLAVRTSLLGAGIGLVPGLGGDVGSWTCYGHAVASSRTPERFGTGVVEGVIAPEAANNSKEGGALLPTLCFGVPGSSGMAILLGAFTLLGIQPGPAVLRDHLDLVWVLIWTLVVANVVAALVFFGIGRWLVLVVSIRPGVLVPTILLLALLGAFVGDGHEESLLVLAALGVVGYALKRCDWPRAPFVIGIVLGRLMEISLHQSLAIWGWTFPLRGGALVLLAAIVATVVVSWRSRRRAAKELITPRLDAALLAGMLGLCLLAIAAASTYPAAVRLVPLVVAVPAACIAGAQLLVTAHGWSRAGHPAWGADEATAPSRSAETRALVWMAAFVFAVAAAGFSVGGPLAVLAAHRMWLREPWRVALIGGATAWVVTAVGFERVLGLPLFGGWVLEWWR
jgi:putative tricarboxylic transport membrane protein